MGEKGHLSAKQAQKFLNVYCKDKNCRLMIGEFIGGGMLGSVFRLKGHTDRAVVVKISQDQGNAKLRSFCNRELEIMGRLGEHPNIVEGLDAMVFSVELGGNPGETAVWGDVYLLFMPEYVELQTILGQRESMTEAELRDLAIDICKALEHCAANSVLHRDVKPGNIFVLENSGGRDTFLLGDFNAARIFTPDTEGAITSIGTKGFAAPEILLSDEDLRRGMKGKVWLAPGLYNSDVYGLGITLYYMLARRIPDLKYRSENAARELPMISEEFERIIMRAVRFDPLKRYRNAAEMRRDLEALYVSEMTEVYRDDQFIWAKEALLGGNLEKAKMLAEQGVDQGEANCRLVLAYCRCIQVNRDTRGADVETFRSQAEPITRELFNMYRESKNAMALFLAGLLCLRGGNERDFCSYMRSTAELGCVPAMFYWGKILNEERYGRMGQKDEGRQFMFRAAEAEFEPALRYVKKYGLRDAGCSDALRQRLESVDISAQADMFSAIVQFL